MILNLTHGNYTPEQLRDELQTQFNSLNSLHGGVEVGLDGSNRLTFTTVKKGSASSLQFSNSVSGTFLYDLCASDYAAVLTSGRALKSTITIDNTTNEFKFTLNNVDQTVTIANGSYSRDGFITVLNAALSGAGLGVSASSYYSSGSYYLRLTTDEKGASANVSISTANMGSSANAIFSGLPGVASGTIALSVQDSITIDSSSNTFNCRIDGSDVSVTLSNGTYTPATLAQELNNKLAGKATVTLNASNQLVFETVSKSGSGSSFYMTYATGGSSMQSIFGTAERYVSGITASLSTDGKQISLTGNNTGTDKSLSFKSYGGSANKLFLPSTENNTSVSPTSVSGTIRKAYIDGSDLSDTVEITDLNKDLTFRLGSSTYITLTLDTGTYSHADLQEALQKKIDDKTGEGILNVTVSASGVRLEAAQAANSIYDMSPTYFSGGFYTYIIRGSTVNTSTKAVTNVDGTQKVSPAYAIGRQDVQNNAVEIIAGSNDVLSADLTIAGNEYKLEMTLDAGSYQGDALADHIQSKLNEALANNGLSAGLVKASIGGFDSGVVNNNDQNALIFSLSTDMLMPEEGEYKIDGISGSAAFYMFYKSDGFPVPNYIQGSADISKGVVIGSDNNTFSFVANGVKYEYTIPEAAYTVEEIIDVLNGLFQDETLGEPNILAICSGDNLKLSFTKFGNNTIHSVTGLSKGDLFYKEQGQINGDNDVKLHLSGDAADSMAIIKQRITTTALGINSITITQPKYAAKALDRLDQALNKILGIRSYFGTLQNRLEHVRGVNDIMEENLQASESAIRDTDMAKESMALARQNILIQAANAMLTQANSNQANVLRLLQ